MSSTSRAPRLSRDGTRVAWNSRKGGRMNVWVAGVEKPFDRSIGRSRAAGVGHAAALHVGDDTGHRVDRYASHLHRKDRADEEESEGAWCEAAHGVDGPDGGPTPERTRAHEVERPRCNRPGIDGWA